MRPSVFNIVTSTYTGAGDASDFGVTGSHASIWGTDVVFQKATMQGSADDPYGNVNVYVSDRTVSAGSVAVQFTKSASSAGTTDTAGVIIITARP